MPTFDVIADLLGMVLNLSAQYSRPMKSQLILYIYLDFHCCFSCIVLLSHLSVLFNRLPISLRQIEGQFYIILDPYYLVTCISAMVDRAYSHCLELPPLLVGSLALYNWLPLWFQYLKMYMEICETRQDDIGIGNACEAMAKAYDRYEPVGAINTYTSY